MNDAAKRYSLSFSLSPVRLHLMESTSVSFLVYVAKWVALELEIKILLLSIEVVNMSLSIQKAMFLFSNFFIEFLPLY